MAGTYEIRIHGVHNTPVAEMLALPEGAGEPVLEAGDRDVGFWQPPPGTPLPKGVTEREAYSWGNLTAATKVRGALSAGSRALWLLLLPFACANVGYWTRDLRRYDDPHEPGGAWAWCGAALYRFAGLLLTAVFVATAVEIGSALLAWQCYAGDDRCSSLPSQLGFVAGKAPGIRLAASLLLPALVLLVLWYVSHRSVQRYEDVPGNPRPAGGAVPAGHVLELPSFWCGRDRVVRLQRLHLGWGLALAVAATAWPMWRMSVHRHATAAEWWHGVDWFCAAAVLAYAAFVTVAQTRDAPEYAPDAARWPSLAAIWAAVAVAASHVLALLCQHLPDTRHLPSGTRYPVDLPGAGAIPVVLVIALVGCVLGMLAIRGRPHLLTIGLFAVAALTAWRFDEHHDATKAGPGPGFYVFAWALAAVGVGWALHSYLRRRHDNQFRGWGGAAPAFLLALGVVLGLLWSTAATLLVADRVNGKPSVSALATTSATGDTATDLVDATLPTCTAGTFTQRQVDVSCTAGHQTVPKLRVPVVYLWVAAALFVAIVGWGAVAGGAFWLSRKQVVDRAEVLRDYGSPAGLNSAEEAEVDRVRSARRMAKFSHRAERVAGLCGPLTAFALLLALTGALTGERPIGAHVPRWLVTVGLYAIALAGLGLLAAGAAMYKGGKARANVAVVWDLTSFWPRAAHPFGPPCYAERAVPELVYRVRWRLADPKNRVLLSGHSLGSTLAVAAFFRLEPDTRGRVLLLTYGSQLRAYFGRLFPSVLGPYVLGHGPLGQARMSGPSETGKPVPDDRTLAGQLDVWRVAAETRWRSLFRRTDYLGFRVFAEGDTNGIDTPTRETKEIPWAAGNPKLPDIDSHGGYPRTDEYEKALERLLGP